jgi:DNA anti-recombination protein RmuC
MDTIQKETTGICKRAADLFRQRQKIEQQLAAIDRRLADARNDYRKASRVYMFTVDNLRTACSLRGML